MTASNSAYRDGSEQGARARQIEDDREYSPRQYHEWFGGPTESTQAKQRLTGDGCPYIKRGRRVTLLGRDIKEHRAKLRRVSTSDQGEPQAA